MYKHFPCFIVSIKSTVRVLFIFSIRFKMEIWNQNDIICTYGNFYFIIRTEERTMHLKNTLIKTRKVIHVYTQVRILHRNASNNIGTYNKYRYDIVRLIDRYWKFSLRRLSSHNWEFYVSLIITIFSYTCIMY